MTARWILTKAAIAIGIGTGAMIAFTLAMTLVFMIPNEPIIKNLARSTDAIDDTYSINGRVIDSNTECIGLSVGVYQNPQHAEQSVFWKSVNATSAYGCEPFLGWVETGQEIETRDYFRYWHGYLVVFRPLMAALPYHDVRGIIFTISLILTAWFLIRTGSDFGFPVALAFAMPLLFLNSLGLVTMVTKAVTWWLVIGGSIWLARPSAPAREAVPALRFFILGCLTAFFDYLTVPILIFAVPFLVYALYALRDEKSAAQQEPIRALFFAAGFFGAGWIGLWASKVALAALVIGPDAVADALGAAAFRLRGDSPSVDSFIPGQAILTNIASLKVLWMPLTLITFVVVPFVKKTGRGEAIRLWRDGAILIATAALPVLFMEVASNHAQIHSAFTHMNFYPALVLLGLILLREVDPLLPEASARASASRL